MLARIAEAALAKAGLWFAEIFEAMFSKAFAAKVFAKTILIGGLIVELARSDYFQNAANWLAAILAKRFLQDPQQIEVSLKLTRQIGTEVSSSQSIIVITFLFCVALTALFISPLLHRAAFRRRLRIFVSFSRLRNDTAEQLQVFLEKCRFRVSRVPFDENAEHQTTIQTIIALLRQSELVVCLPGPTYSFVEHEIMAANAIGHPVVFLVSGDDGTIPNTADKRYPIFQIETLAGNGFHPIETFLSFIGGDLRSMQNICAHALRQGRSLSLAIGLAILLVIVGLWILSFLAVRSTPTATLAAQTTPLEASIAIGTHVLILAFCASVAALSLIYCARVLHSQIRQRRAQRIARLKATDAQYNRDEWADLMRDVSFGATIYRAMFDTAPMAHHEKMPPPQPA